jgi:hypothetical protein
MSSGAGLLRSTIVIVNRRWTARWLVLTNLQCETLEEAKLQFEFTKWSCFVIKITSLTREHERLPIFSNSHLHNSPRSVIWYKVCGPFILDAGSCKICGGLEVWSFRTLKFLLHLVWILWTLKSGFQFESFDDWRRRGKNKPGGGGGEGTGTASTAGELIENFTAVHVARQCRYSAG